MTTTPEQLPRIIRFIRRSDSGEFGADCCAHCGAKGRYQWSFLCDDGKQHAAMAGCIRLYPVSKVAKIHAALMEKEAKLKGETWPNGSAKTLNKWDSAKLEAIDAFYRGEKTEDEVYWNCRSEDQKRDDWMRHKGYRR